MRKRWRKAARWTLYVFSCIVFLEICLAVVVPAPGFEQITISDGDGSEYQLSDNRKLIYEPRANTGTFNEGGYRGPYISPEKPPGTTRWVLMGDSVAEGLGVETKERFSDLLANRLGAGYEIVNLSVRGYNLAQEAEYFKKHGLAYQPAHVVFVITYNDLQLHSGELVDISNRIEKSRKSSIHKAYYTATSKTSRLLLRTHIYRHIRTRMLRKKSFLDTMQYMLHASDIDPIVAELQSLSKEHGFHLAFIFLPVQATDEQMVRIRSVLDDRKVRYLDLHQGMRRTETPKTWPDLFLRNDPCHLSVKGHIAVSDAILEDLQQLLPVGE